MVIAVLGASGLLGAPLSRLLEEQGHEVRRLHRSSMSHPVDLRTGEGLEAALAGVAVVVNAANASGRGSAGVMVAGTRRLLAASDAHHVCVSIVGVDALAPHNSYFRAKREQEALVSASGRPFSIVRSTQFHEFVGGFALRFARWRIELHAPVLLAPIAADEAAAMTARTATREPRNATITVIGPERLSVTQLRAGRGLPLAVPLRGGLGQALRSGALAGEAADVRGVLTYGQWLARARGRPWRPTPQRPRG